MKNNNSGVYKITNTINNKFYIGSSNNLIDRWDTHLRKLINNNHDSKLMQVDFNYYGNVFIFEVIKFIKNNKKLRDFEKHCINKFNPNYNSHLKQKDINIISFESKIVISKIINKKLKETKVKSKSIVSFLKG